jgi:hypothetical protein
VLLVHTILSRTLFSICFGTHPFPCFGTDILYGCSTVWARAISWSDLSDEAAENCPANFCFGQDCSDWSKGRYLFSVGFLYYSIILINLTYSLSSFEKIPILPSRTYILSSQSSEKCSNDGIIPMTVSFNGQCYAGNRIGNIFFPLTSWILKGGFVLFCCSSACGICSGINSTDFRLGRWLWK